jgi:hypothetical protein
VPGNVGAKRRDDVSACVTLVVESAGGQSVWVRSCWGIGDIAVIGLYLPTLSWGSQRPTGLKSDADL